MLGIKKEAEDNEDIEMDGVDENNEEIKNAEKGVLRHLLKETKEE